MLFNAANILLLATIAIAGVSVVFPVSLEQAPVIGAVVNYINASWVNLGLLLGGMGLIVITILLNVFAYR